MNEGIGRRGPRVDPVRRGAGRPVKLGDLAPLLTTPPRSLIGSRPRPIKPAPKREDGR